MDTLLSRHWHHLPQGEVATLLESNDAKGLDTFEVAHRQTHFGPNRLTLKKGRSPLLGLMLAFEGKEPGIMDRPPRRPETPVLTGILGFRIGLVSLMLLAGAFGLFEWMLLQAKSVEMARTAAVNMFVFGEIFYLFNCRSLQYTIFKLGVFSNRWLILGVATMVLLQVLFTYSPVMNRLFGSAPMGMTEWAWVLTGGLMIYTVVGTEKWLRRRAAGKKGR